MNGNNSNNALEGLVEQINSGETREKEKYGPVKPPLKDSPKLLLNIFLGLVGVIAVSVIMDPASRCYFWLAVIVYSVACLKNISPEEKGIKVTLWTPNESYMHTGGLYWRWFLFQWFYLFPTEQVILNIPEQQVVTAEKTVTIDGKEKVYSEADIGVDAVLYFFWPNNPVDLCQAYRKAPSPSDLAKLHKFFKPSMAATIRRVAGRFSWLEVRVSGQEYMDTLHNEISGNIRGPIVKSGITDFNIENELVKLPPELEKAITMEQEAIYAKEAGKHNAELDKIKITKEGEGKAEARRAILAAMAENPEMAKLLTLQEMAQGGASTIFYELPKELRGAISEVEIPEELQQLWNALPKPERTVLMTEFLKSLKKK
jgi:regulator of protease activity HflC (stomatin/prohibitin superfamily)